MAEPHGYPPQRLPKCTTEYAVRLRQMLPRFDGDLVEYDQYFKATNFEHARDLAVVIRKDAAVKADRTEHYVHVVARIVTEWVEINEESDSEPSTADG